VSPFNIAVTNGNLIGCSTPPIFLVPHKAFSMSASSQWQVNG
jgi:hypothetical protein